MMHQLYLKSVKIVRSQQMQTELEGMARELYAIKHNHLPEQVVQQGV